MVKPLGEEVVRLRIKPWSSYSRIFSLSVVLPDVVEPRRLHTTSLATEDGGRLPPVELSVYEEAFAALTIEATLHVGSHDTVEPGRLLVTSLLTEDGGRLPLAELAVDEDSFVIPFWQVSLCPLM